MMSLTFGQLAHALHEAERLAEVAEPERALDAAGIIAQLPIGGLLLQPQRFIACQKRYAAAAGRTGLLGQSLAHGVSPSMQKRRRRPPTQRSNSPNKISNEPKIA